MEYSGGIFFKFFETFCWNNFVFKKIIDAFDRKIGPDAENAVHFIKNHYFGFLNYRN